MTSDPFKPQSVITLASAEEMALKIRQRRQLKGRQADDVSLQEVSSLLNLQGDALQARKDLLIEHLHKINDTYRGLHERHLVALAKL
ncbi:MAG: NADH-quinone oxidoreductase subunit, partial [Pseudomonadota bacterium]